MKHVLYASVIVISATFLVAGCKKKKEEVLADTRKDCDKNNYGIVTVNFAADTVRHGILITYPKLASRDKIVARGTLQDTIHLPSASYPISVSSINDAGQAYQEQTFQILTSKCSEHSINVKF